MPFTSVDKLQNALARNVFRHTKDSKKAAGRALGTIVEIITYYFLKTWGHNNDISIERGLAEYGNPDIRHNVEYSLHPVIQDFVLRINKPSEPITASKILGALEGNSFTLSRYAEKKNTLLTKDGVLRNACTIAESENSHLLCSILSRSKNELNLYIYEQHSKPYAIFECKRVGVEEGMKKGPQTIEKAKQGAYVARVASSLQKVRTESGEMYGIIYRSDNSSYTKPYIELMEEVIDSNDAELLRRFILTIGVVSNHGNWFTSENHNKELKVLAQSYDWLLFLTDDGLSEFIERLLLNPSKEFSKVRSAFISSYAADKKKNQFTKVQMNIHADQLLLKYFSQNIKSIENWFNIISPKGKQLPILKKELLKLKTKDWREILT